MTASHSSEREQVIREMMETASKHGLQLQPGPMEINESGMDFLVGIAQDADGTSWVLRKPRREDVLKRAENEARTLKLIQSRLPVEVPAWRIYTPELIAYPLLAGKPAASVSLDGYAWNMDHVYPGEIFITSLAEALTALHNIGVEEARNAGLRVKSPEEARNEMSRNMEEIRNSLGVSRLLWERWQKWIHEDSYWPDHSAVIHGDLHPPHILIDEQRKVTGLLDWTEAEVTNPGKDFILYYAVHGESNLKLLLQRYEEVGGKVWPRMYDHIVEQYAAYPVLIGQFALLTGQEDMLAMARHALGVDDDGPGNVLS